MKNTFLIEEKHSLFFSGVKGLILNEYSQPIPFTQVMIDDRRPVINVTPLGEFWRILLPGMYTLKVKTPEAKLSTRTE